MTDATLTLIVASGALAVTLVRLSVIAARLDVNSPARLVAELRLAQFAALVLALFGGIYIGIPLVQESSPGAGVDVALAIGFLAVASAAITQEPTRALTLVSLGFAGHAVIALAHGADILPSDSVPEWFSAACAIYDVTVAAVCYLPIVRRP
tara:strand:+ start:223 stop:678 length:456 start_codon:yes stop_codon:yes gene_type:complete